MESKIALVRARWVLPVDRPPIDGGWIALEEGVIRTVGRGQPPSGPLTDLGDTAILPGLINAHTHLELSWLAGRVPPASSMDAWIRRLMSLRREASPLAEVQQVTASMAAAKAREQGTIAFADISNTLVTAPVLAEGRAPSVLFHELLGFAAHDAAARAAEGADRVEGLRHQVRPGLAPHAPYSVAPDLFAAIDRESCERQLPSSVHLGESPEEIEFLMTGGGPLAGLLKELGVWRDDWAPPGVDPVTYLDRLGVLRAGLLVVHATHLKADALATLAARRCVIVSCPRSNRWVGAGDPPLDAFYASGATVALGTDSLASVESLDMFAELAAARAISSVPHARLLESATRGGAIALGLEDSYGRIAPGMRGPLLAVRVGADATDVEEYLVSGKPRDMQWVG
ncbi:MAG: amidohydrolase family protein [Acidobacteriota bacterium]|nr:amidohydrolase family protein [Acidobacteriota bacterium]